MSGSSISWSICKSAPRSRQITTPAPPQLSFLQTGCPSCRPTNSIKALKAMVAEPVISKVKKKQRKNDSTEQRKNILHKLVWKTISQMSGLLPPIISKQLADVMRVISTFHIWAIINKITHFIFLFFLLWRLITWYWPLCRFSHNVCSTASSAQAFVTKNANYIQGGSK